MVAIPGAGGARGGSFGVPAEVQEAAQKARDQARKERDARGTPAQGATAATADASDDMSHDSVAPRVEDTGFSGLSGDLPTDATAKKLDPLDQLRKIGVDFTEEDVHNLVFKGTVSKEIAVFKGVTQLSATLKALTVEECDLVDELTAEEIGKTAMTNSGADSRRAIWTLAFAVTHLNGRMLRDLDKEGAVGKDGIDLKKKAQLYREALRKMSPYVMRVLGELQSIYAASLNLLMEGGSPFLERA
jgi:hypothetical protein